MTAADRQLPGPVSDDLFGHWASDIAIDYLVDDIKEHGFGVVSIRQNNSTIGIELIRHDSNVAGIINVNKAGRVFEAILTSGTWSYLPMRGQWTHINAYLARVAGQLATSSDR